MRFPYCTRHELGLNAALQQGFRKKKGRQHEPGPSIALAADYAEANVFEIVVSKSPEFRLAENGGLRRFSR
jgi:hypothetical protein